MGAAGWAAAGEFAAGAVSALGESDLLQAAASKSNQKMFSRAWDLSCLISPPGFGYSRFRPTLFDSCRAGAATMA